MSVWIQLDSDYPMHPKTLRLCSLLGEGADAYPVRLWTWCAKYAKDGRPDVAIIEEVACRWRGAKGALFKALTDIGFLDSDGSVHDWWDWTGASLQALEQRREAARKAMRRKRKRSPNVSATLAQRDANVKPTLAHREEKLDELEKQENLEKKKDHPPAPSKGRGDDAVISRVFDHYRHRFAKRDPYSLTPKRRSKIAARLSEIGEEACIAAIDRAAEDTWFRETCSSNGVETILRSQDDAEKWASKAPKNGGSGKRPSEGDEEELGFDEWLTVANRERQKFLDECKKDAEEQGGS